MSVPSTLFRLGMLCVLALAGCTDEANPVASNTSSGATTGPVADPSTASQTSGGTDTSGGASGEDMPRASTTENMPDGPLEAGSTGGGVTLNGTPGITGGTPDAATTDAGGVPEAGSDTFADAGSDTSPDAESGTSPEPVFHVFLLLGQSNMAGYPKAQPADQVDDPRVRVLGYDDCAETGRREGQWATAAPPLHECWNQAIGPGDYFAKTLLDTLPENDTVGLVPCAISGEKIETFMKAGGAKYSWILKRAQAALETGGVIDGMLFHQGESNCGDNAWPDKVKTLVNDLRQDLGLGEVPFLAGELVYSGACAQHNPLVAQLPGLISNAHIVSAEGLALDSSDARWRLHFGHDAQVEFGRRYAHTMAEALGW